MDAVCFLFAILNCLAPSSASSLCGLDKVMSLPIRNVQLSDGAVARGIPLNVGTPPQILAISPSLSLNETWLYDQQAELCDADHLENCTTYRGNLYDNSTSSTYVPTTTIGVIDGVRPEHSRWILDTLTLTPNISLPQFKMGIALGDIGDNYHPLHTIGLGSSSSLLSALVARGSILSKTCSFFWGMAGATAPATRDGSYLLGGFDNAIATGQNYTAKMRTPTFACSTGMQVGVTGLGLNFPNGTQASLLPQGDGGFLACLEPDWQMAINVAYDPYYYTFEYYTDTTSIGRSAGPNFWGMLYDPKDVFQGDLVIELDGGLSTTVLNSQLVVPDQYIDADTGAVSGNRSATEVLINSLQEINSNDMPKIGRPFFSGAYLMADHDASEFTLWTVSPEEQTSQSIAQQLVPVGGACTGKAGGQTTGPGPVKAGHTDDGVGKGAIAGIVIGVLVAAAAAATLVAFCIRSQRRRQVAYTGNCSTSADMKRDLHAPLPAEPQEMPGIGKAAALSETPPSYSPPYSGHRVASIQPSSSMRSLYEMPTV